MRTLSIAIFVKTPTQMFHAAHFALSAIAITFELFTAELTPIGKAQIDKSIRAVTNTGEEQPLMKG